MLGLSSLGGLRVLGQGFWECDALLGTLSQLPPCHRSEEDEEEKKDTSTQDTSLLTTDGPEPVSSRV